MITERSKSIILLTGYLPGSDKKLKPLSTLEWNKLASWLHKRELMPEDLTGVNQEKILNEWDDFKILKDRLMGLLGRGATMAICLDKWQRAGVWLINRSEADYPTEYKIALIHKAPPIFYGIGNRKLLITDAVGVVGSRNITEEELSYAHRLGKRISDEGYSVISGGAKGIDENSMLGALENEGTCIGILADRLLQRSTSKIYRRHIMDNNLVLLSPYHPEARFNVGNAMSRNKFIYIKSKATFVVHSGTKGGTWTGAEENLKYKWVPIYVKMNNYPDSGNRALLKLGATELRDNISEIDFKFDGLKKEKLVSQSDLFSKVEESNNSEYTDVAEKSAKEKVIDNPILLKLLELLRDDFKEGFTKKEVAKHYDVLPSQMKKWLKILEDKNCVLLESADRYKLQE